ncbi:MAG: phosphoribosylglycinamide formyltransferase [Patescibacteria group bacterium]
MTYKIAVLASTRGTDLKAIFDEIDAGLLANVEVAIVVSNVENCGALDKAKAHNVKAVFVDPAGKNKEEYDEELASQVGEVDLVCLIGYMKILTEGFVKKYEGKIINVHPALLPKYGGKGFYGQNVHEAVIAAGENESGMTIHFVTSEVDGGEILIQEKVAIEEGETAESLREKVQVLEKKYYPEAIRLLSRKRHL